MVHSDHFSDSKYSNGGSLMIVGSDVTYGRPLLNVSYGIVM